MTEKQGREEFRQIVKIEASGIVHGPGRRDIEASTSGAELAAALFGGGNPQQQRPEMPMDGHQHERGGRRR